METKARVQHPAAPRHTADVLLLSLKALYILLPSRCTHTHTRTQLAHLEDYQPAHWTVLRDQDYMAGRKLAPWAEKPVPVVKNKRNVDFESLRQAAKD